ncbi:Iron-sulfur flavoprotein [uncultured archaeon]|nr:Iron-sulfur flavoprotein [uncultured archaeon]
MKVVAFNGSARKDGNTAALIKHVLAELESEGIETELVQLSERPIRGCTACYKCYANKNKRCAVEDDVVNECIEKMLEADGIVLGSPSYFADVSAILKALIERAGMTARANDNMFGRKVGAAVVAARRSGSVHTFDSINHFFTIGEMIVVGSSYWNIGFGGNKGDVENDAEAVKTMKTLGRNMAWLLKKVNKGAAAGKAKSGARGA